MKSAVIFLPKDPRPAREREFHKVAMDEFAELDCIGIASIPALTGSDLINAAASTQAQLHHEGLEYLDHLAMIMHGSTTGLLRPGSGYGLHSSASSPPRLYSVHEFARAWAPVLADGALISLCACLTARDPAWYLRQIFGSLPSSWGPRSYRPGGTRSFAGRMRDAFVRLGRNVRIRAHTVVGHVTGSPMLREFRPVVGEPGQPLFQIALPMLSPTLANRRKWVRVVRGQLARDWIMGDDSTVDRIRQAWDRS